MLFDQSFSAKNFRTIFDLENRKGNYLESRYFPDIKDITVQLKKCATEFKKLKKDKSSLSPTKYADKKGELNSKKDTLKKQKEELLQLKFNEISKVVDADFRIELTQVKIQGKSAYSLNESDAVSYFLIKQIQYNLKRLYNVKQNSRHDIICQLRSLLNNGFPKFIIRTDVQHFYESISQERLLELIDNDYLLAPLSKKFIHKILEEYKLISGSSKGVPRGIGLSAYLAELYMMEFDENIKKHPEIIFYARYVDDIIAIYTPNPNSNTSELQSVFQSIFHREAEKLELMLHSDKTNNIDLIIKKDAKFSYLGYSFKIRNEEFCIQISKQKTARYKKRIELAFNDYKKYQPNEKIARKLFVKRLRYLTGNTKLSNNKNNALIGIYFSNCFITNTSSLSGLDKFLQHIISKISSSILKQKLGKMSFQHGWSTKRFHKFSPTELKEIVSVWKNVT